MSRERPFTVQRQPDDITCGPTCLFSIYDYYGEPTTLAEVVGEIPMLEGGGTLAAMLGHHALKRGYRSWIYTFNLEVFDPTWFQLPPAGLIAKLETQLQHKEKPKLHVASRAYVDFLQAGGLVKFHDLTTSLISDYLLQGIPIITGLSSTYLYKTAREIGDHPVADDIRGEPQGHFVILTAYDPEENSVTIADPWHPESYDKGHTYRIPMEHLVCAILLGVMTYDGNLLIITK